jgi:uncharacterized protein
MILLDTGPLVALLDRREDTHRWAEAALRQIREPLWTCGAVLSEASFLVGRFLPALSQLNALVRTGIVRPVGEDRSSWNRALDLMRQYANVPMSFADACLVTIAEQHESTRIFTLDRDFLVYRLQNGAAPTLIAPFAGIG